MLEYCHVVQMMTLDLHVFYGKVKFGPLCFCADTNINKNHFIYIKTTKNYEIYFSFQVNTTNLDVYSNILEIVCYLQSDK